MTQPKSRRDVLLGAAALASAASLPRKTLADTKGRIVVGTWGGDYARLLAENIDTPILKPTGMDVIQAVGITDYTNRVYNGIGNMPVQLYVGFYASQRSRRFLE